MIICVIAVAVAVGAACGDPVRSTPSTAAPVTTDPGTQAPPSATTDQSQTPDQAETHPSTVEEGGAAGERIDWTPCGSGVQCGYVEVPADYRDPASGGIRIAVNVHRATAPEKRIGYLLVNPGGPGESGVELVHGVPLGAFPDEVVARFDIIGFDPRGVGDSEPAFACGAPGEQIALLATIDGAIDTSDEIAAGEAAADLCIESMGPVAGLLHSAYVARDMDEIRKALGAETITYLGFSYGSALGVWYATLFPGSVRAMVVDGAANPVKPVATQEERTADDIKMIATVADFLEKALNACADPECPIYRDGDPIGYFLQAAEKLDIVNDAAGHPEAGSFGVISTLYAEDTWPALWHGLFELHEYEDPSILLEFAAFQLGPEPNAASFTAHVNCLDDWVLHPQVDRAAQLDDLLITTAAVEEMFPLLAAMESLPPDLCPFYDRFAPEALDIPLDGGGTPILVVGNHEDPFTSFRESEELVTRTLNNGYLVETFHPTHTVYPDNNCVNDYVHQVLIDGIYPDERRVLCDPQS